MGDFDNASDILPQLARESNGHQVRSGPDSFKVFCERLGKLLLKLI